MNPNLLRAMLMSKQSAGLLYRATPKFGSECFQEKSSIELDEFYFTVLEKIGVDCLLECGAHGAEASIRFCKTGKRSIAIEANPLTYQRKTRAAEQHNVDVLNVGLGSAEDELEFFIPEWNELAGNATFQPKKGEKYETEKIQVTTIDNIIEVKNIRDSKIALWIDVEGFSREVLLGASEILSRDNCAVIKIEVETYPYFHGQALCSEVNDYLKSFGFVPVLVDDEYTDQFNVVYIKELFIDGVSRELLSYWRGMGNIKYTPKDFAVHLARFLNLKSRLVVKRTVFLVLGEASGHKLLAKCGIKSSKMALKSSERAEN